MSRCWYNLQAQNFSRQTATIVVGVATIITDQIATNCDWDCNNFGLFATIVVGILTLVVDSDNMKVATTVVASHLTEQTLLQLIINTLFYQGTEQVI